MAGIALCLMAAISVVTVCALLTAWHCKTVKQVKCWTKVTREQIRGLKVKGQGY